MASHLDFAFFNLTQGRASVTDRNSSKLCGSRLFKRFCKEEEEEEDRDEEEEEEGEEKQEEEKRE